MNAEQMTIEQIQEQFDSEWVLVGEPQRGAASEVLGGQVICHSKDRDEVYRQLIARKPKSSAILYTGGIPDGTAVVL